MRAMCSVLGVVMLVFALGACGESDEDCEAEAATEAFASSVEGIASELGSSLSAADAKAQVVTALDQLAASYRETFAPLDCN